MVGLTYATINTVSNKQIAPAGGDAQLWTVNINTAAAGAILKLYDGTSTSGTLVATIDASKNGSYCYGVVCKGGIFIDLSIGTADCTIGYR